MPNVGLLLILSSVLLMLWGAVFSVLHWRVVLREAAGVRARYNNFFLERRRTMLEPAPAGGIAANEMDRAMVEPCLSDETSRARAYLQRVLSLLHGAETDGGYLLDVGKTRFHVKDRYVRRLQDSADPKCSCEVTCFYSIHEGIPREEEIASVLLQLNKNPALFDKWAKQNGLPFKPDGQEFTCAP